MKTVQYIFFATILLLIGCEQKKEETEEKQQFAMTDTMYNECTFANATTDFAQNEIRLFGKVTADNNSMAQVYPAVGGNVISIDVRTSIPETVPVHLHDPLWLSGGAGRVKDKRQGFW